MATKYEDDKPAATGAATADKAPVVGKPETFPNRPDLDPNSDENRKLARSPGPVKADIKAEPMEIPSKQ